MDIVNELQIRSDKNGNYSKRRKERYRGQV